MCVQGCLGVGMNVGVMILTCMHPICVCVCVFFFLVRLLYWCVFCTNCNLCFSLRAHRFSLVSLWLHIVFPYLYVRVFCSVLVRVNIVVHVCVRHRVSFVVLLAFSLSPANQVIFNCTSVHYMCRQSTCLLLHLSL